MALSDSSIDKIKDAASEAQRFRVALSITHAAAEEQLGAPIPVAAFDLILADWQKRMDNAAAIVENEVMNPVPAPGGK